MNFIAIIPSRYASSRLEGKPLIDIWGKSMVQRVYENAIKALDQVYVATDDKRIFDHVKGFGGNVLMTSPTHLSGTDRCVEALEIISKISDQPIDIIINIQGDEPLFLPEQIETLKSCFDDPTTEMATLVVPIKNPDSLNNESEVFVTFDLNYKALYFSRSVIPYVARMERSKWFKKTTFYKHLGFYAYTKEALKTFTTLPQTHLEKTEFLEQNRWLEHGKTIKIAITNHDTVSIDTLQDLEMVRTILRS